VSLCSEAVSGAGRPWQGGAASCREQGRPRGRRGAATSKELVEPLTQKHRANYP
jgi:hypothetical protein